MQIGPISKGQFHFDLNSMGKAKKFGLRPVIEWEPLVSA